MALLTSAVTTSNDHPRRVPRMSADVRELRLALVCDGGVSLAIYIHGVTRELQNVVTASRAVDRFREGEEDGLVRRTGKVQPRRGWRTGCAGGEPDPGDRCH